VGATVGIGVAVGRGVCVGILVGVALGASVKVGSGVLDGNAAGKLHAESKRSTPARTIRFRQVIDVFWGTLLSFTRL
jgi:hypothetical protein